MNDVHRAVTNHVAAQRARLACRPPGAAGGRRAARAPSPAAPSAREGRSPRWPLPAGLLALGSMLACAAAGAPADETRPEAGAAARALSTPASGCFAPEAYGAVPDDGLDDRPAAQLAIDAAAAAGGGRVCFGAGRFTLTRAPAGSYNRFAALSTHSPHIEIQGAGPGTVLEVVGDQAKADLWVIALDPGARDITIRDLTIDTSATSNTSEQFHAIEIGSGLGTGPVEDVRIDHVGFRHPEPADGSRKGDCLRLVGATPASAVRRVTVIGGTFTSCARSGIAIQRNVFDLIVQGNQFTHASDQDIDSEPSGGPGDLNGSIAIVGNVFRDDPAVAQGDWSVTVGGIGGPMARVVVANNVFEGRGLASYRASDVTVTGNAFDATMESGYGVIEVGNVADRVSVAGNAVRRRGAAGPLLRAVHHSGAFATNLAVTGNVFVNDTPGGGIVMESVQDVSVSDNDFRWNVAAPAAPGIYLRSTIRPADGVMIAGNRLAGDLLAAVFFGATQPFQQVSLVGNMHRGAGLALRCDTSPGGGYAQPIVYAANNWAGGKQCAAAALVSERQ
ncbi:MAG TPA: right-handed parallel beta-helix repeat-containing protein [Polyangiaceae bacterium]|nr:right-handed parallel beta-helix repeat-containing protein [Polyangiaceae bacterium]